MNLSDLSSLLLTYIVTYGPAALGLVVFLAAVGVPIPSSFFVIAGGAFVQQGVMDFFPTAAATLVGAVLGDMLSFCLGLWLQRFVRTRFGGSPAWRSAEAYFKRRGALTVYLTRWLLTPVSVPVNLVAGSSGYSPWQFGLNAFLGELTWVVAFGGLGYWFGSQWEYVSDFVSNFSGLLVGLVLLAAGLFWLFKRANRPS